MPPKLSHEYVKKQIESVEGYELLTVKYENSKSTIKIRHNRDHTYETTYSRFQQGYRCSVCSEQKLDYNYIKQQIENKGYELLSEIYENSQTNLRIRCNKNKNHIFEMCWSNFNKGSGCRHCYIESLKLTYNFVKEKIEESKYTLISTEYIDHKSLLLIQCDKNHEPYESTWDNFRDGHRCRRCYFEGLRLEYDFIKSEIEKEKYTLLSLLYENNKTPLTIQCDKKHEPYETCWNNFQQNNRCPHCNRSKGEEAIQEFLTKLGLGYISQYRDSRCKNKNPLPFDIYVPSLNLKIEWDGREHNEPVEIFGGEEGFKERQINDEIKNRFCVDNKINLVRISYKNYDNIENVLTYILFEYIMYYCFFDDEITINHYLIKI